MNYFITDAPEMSLPFQISSIPAQITLTGKNDIEDISPITENLNETETYEFVLGHDNLVDMYDINNPPIADFTFAITDQGAPPAGTAPIANFNYQAL
jgi:hypothetical protein